VTKVMRLSRHSGFEASRRALSVLSWCLCLSLGGADDLQQRRAQCTPRNGEMTADLTRGASHTHSLCI